MQKRVIAFKDKWVLFDKENSGYDI
jgi:hypothetical protein